MMETTTATQATAIALTPDTLQAIARLIAAVEKITLALGTIDTTLEQINKQIESLADESRRQTLALEQIQTYSLR